MKPPNPLDTFEHDITANYDAGEFVSLAPAAERLSRFKAAASATFLKDKRINIRLSSPDLMDIQEKAMNAASRIKRLSPACCINTRLGVW
jgi:predicted DNA binding CopG/RHH family protein